MSVRNVTLSGVAALFIALMTPFSAMAEMLILESDVPGYQVSTTIPDSNNLDLPPCGRVKVLVLPSNQTKVFNGSNCPSSSSSSVGTSRGPPRVRGWAPPTSGVQILPGDPTVPPPSPHR
jgi:hypothetical protein